MTIKLEITYIFKDKKYDFIEKNVGDDVDILTPDNVCITSIRTANGLVSVIRDLIDTNYSMK